jgi:hypothetical protein
MQAEKVKSGYLSRAFRKAFLMGFATMTLGFGTARAQNATEDDVYYTPNGKAAVTTQTVVTTPQKDSAAVFVQKQPWQNDAYDQELEAARQIYEAKIDVIHKRADANVIRIEAYKETGITRLYTSGHIRLVYAIVQTKAIKEKAEAEKIKVRADEEFQLANLHNQYIKQQMSIEQRYKTNYERQQQTQKKNYVAPKTADQQKLDSTKEQIKLEQEQLKLDQQQLKIDQERQKLEAQRQALNKKKQAPQKNSPKKH